MSQAEALQPQAPVAARHGASRLILFLTVFIDLLGFGIVIPFLPLFAARLGVGAIGVGAVLAMYSLAQLLCAPILGAISDRTGRRPVILLGLAGSAAGYLIYGFAASFVWLLISRAVHGACAATVSTAQAYIADTTDESERAHGMGIIGAAFGLGFIFGPALGGLLGHSGLRTPALFASGLSLANFVFALFYLRESHDPRRASLAGLGQLFAPLLELPRNLAGSHLSKLFSTAFLLTFTFAVLETTFALVAARIYGYGAAGIGGLLAFAGLMQALAQGYLLRKIVNRIGELKLITAGALAMALGLAPIGSSHSHALLLVALALIALGYGFASPSVASLISKRTTRHKQGEVLGTNQAALSLARIAGPMFGGAAYQIAGSAAPYLAGAVLMIIVMAISTGLGEASPRP